MLLKLAFKPRLIHYKFISRWVGVLLGALYRGISASLKRIWTEEGIRGLYRGLGPVMVGCLPTWYNYRCRIMLMIGAFIFRFMSVVK